MSDTSAAPAEPSEPGAETAAADGGGGFSGAALTTRLAATLRDMAQTFAARPAMVAREMTKKFEERIRAPLDELAAAYDGRPPPKGEVVVVVGPPFIASLRPGGVCDTARDRRG